MLRVSQRQHVFMTLKNSLFKHILRALGPGAIGLFVGKSLMLNWEAGLCHLKRMDDRGFNSERKYYFSPNHVDSTVELEPVGQNSALHFFVEAGIR